MTRVTTCGSEIRDRCPALTSVMRAPARLAMNSCSAGGITQSVDAVAPGKLDKAEAEAGDTKGSQGRWLGTQTVCPTEVADLYEKSITAPGQCGLAG
jgi:hypothetical protein